MNQKDYNKLMHETGLDKFKAELGAHCAGLGVSTFLAALGGIGVIALVLWISFWFVGLLTVPVALGAGWLFARKYELFHEYNPELTDAYRSNFENYGVNSNRQLSLPDIRKVWLGAIVCLKENIRGIEELRNHGGDVWSSTYATALQAAQMAYVHLFDTYSSLKPVLERDSNTPPKAINQATDEMVVKSKAIASLEDSCLELFTKSFTGNDVHTKAIQEQIRQILDRVSALDDLDHSFALPAPSNDNVEEVQKRIAEFKAQKSEQTVSA